MLTADGHEEVEEGPATRTALDGTFRLRLDAGVQVHLRVAAAGLAPTEVCQVQAGERLRIVLRDPVRLVVRTKDEGGHAVADVALRLFSSGGLGRPLTGLTDASGDRRLPRPRTWTSLWVEAVHASLGYPGGRRRNSRRAGRPRSRSSSRPAGRSAAA